ncbi:sensor histidine kinase [Enterovirga rhinocerotis]|uniref:Blue-light-activated histidine kinase n=1 Tax=Enterovirga rhinocerotis TaxID=1339210 RepID=A0A4R7BTG5_9HYPH|nr:HWE histidine kinase domain-containing protein [Enterovirga rhinocerotis]TDR87296.1 PAS domain S-box-containing protein [Enterovirga rhinocerotis]
MNAPVVPRLAALVLPPGLDPAPIAAALHLAGIAPLSVPLPWSATADLAHDLRRCGLAIVVEKALDGDDLDHIATVLAAETTMADYPVIILSSRPRLQARLERAERRLAGLAEVMVLDWPPHPATLAGLARAALAGRRRDTEFRERVASLEASRAASVRSDERLKFAIAAAKLGFWELSFPERRLVASDLCKVNLGLPPDEDLTYDGLLDIVHPEDRQKLLDLAQQAIDGHTDYDIECRIAVPSPGQRWAEIRGRATYENGEATGMVGLCLDITERKAAEDRQHFLMRELHHRVKNTLSTVQAIVGATARGATSIDQFYRDFTGRVISLANTHTVLTEELWQRASLHELLAKELDLYDHGNERVRVNGPPLELPSGFAVPLGMAFHELATNAAKYGALANGAGTVSIDWTVDETDRPPRVRVAWTEQDGPPVSPPTRQGFGTRLLERVLTAQMHAEVGIDYDPAGLRVQVSFRLPEGTAGMPSKG